MKGKGAFHFLDPNKNGVNKFFTRDLPSTLIHQGLPAVGATVGGIMGSELGPVGSMAGAYAGRKAGEATAKKIGKLYGYGLYSDLKKVEKAALKRGSKRKGLLEDVEKIKYGIDYAKNRYPSEYEAIKMKGMGNFWNNIQPATTYLRPVGDALLNKTVEKIQGLGLKRRVQRKKPYDRKSFATSWKLWRTLNNNKQFSI